VLGGFSSVYGAPAPFFREKKTQAQNIIIMSPSKENKGGRGGEFILVKAVF